MAQRTITHMYDRYEDAEQVVTDLESAGIPESDISLVANADSRGQNPATTTGTTAGAAAAAPEGTGAATGATVGTAIGGGLGLLAGIGSLAIPGVGPVIAAGWLVATLTGAGVGAAGGGLLGSLTGAGVGHDEAHVYAEGLRSGSVLVTARVDEADAGRVEAMMNQRNPVDWQQRRASYGTDWKGFDETAAPRTTRVYSAEKAPGVPERGADGTFAPGTDPGRRL